MFFHFFLVSFTEANSTAPESDEAEWKGRSGESRSGTIKTPISENMPLANTGKVKFDPPSVPVIFVLGNHKRKYNLQLSLFRIFFFFCFLFCFWLSVS